MKDSFLSFSLSKMVACPDAAARHSSSFDKYFAFVVCFLSVFLRTLAAAYVQYSRDNLLTAADYYICNEDTWDFVPPEIRKLICYHTVVNLSFYQSW